MGDKHVDFDDRRQAHWLQTSTDGHFYPSDPRPEDFCMDNIANGLAQQVRYGGQGRIDRFYSVAEHSALMANYALRNFGPEEAYVALLHDGAEGIGAGDAVHSFKQIVYDLYKPAELRIQGAIWKHFGMERMAQEHEHLVKSLDRRIVLNEKRVLFRRYIRWTYDETEVPLEGVYVACMLPVDAKRFFATTYFNIARYLGVKPEEIM